MAETQQDIVPQQVPLHGPGQHPLPCSSDWIDPTTAEAARVSGAEAGMIADGTLVNATGADTEWTTGGTVATSATAA
ncbi:hypothetical protein HCU64_21225 [Methylobacterium sp. C25]|uniref:hypothetical protein n=1 Tax=Methylobacterium sp. C25 TaxID=2721622 RepID=UPI001F427453|nr:hypothetical protein [Methylobacterium sp. C25]MCE4226277.1 hypothetical protein [Methylobacterium sp. C25]